MNREKIKKYIVMFLLVDILFFITIIIITGEKYRNKSFDDICIDNGFKGHTDIRNSGYLIECDNLAIIDWNWIKVDECLDYNKWNECINRKKEWVRNYSLLERKESRNE